MDDMLKVLILVVSLVGAGVFAYAAITSINVRNRRLLGRAGSGQELLDELHARLAATEALEGRVEELEQRVDFAERLIAQQHEPERLPAGPAPGHR
jgi:hypothetical protein